MIAAGILTAAIISFSQLFFYQASDLSKKEVKTDQHDDSRKDNSSPDQFYFSIPSSNVHSSTHVDSGPDFSFLLEVLFSAEKPAQRVVQSPVSVGKLFQTLFQVIIAPNAP
jgi:hypothetical protein